MTNDRAASLLFLASGAYGVYFSAQLPMGSWNQPGPGIFPAALSLLLLLSGAAWFIRGKGKQRAADEDRRTGAIAVVKNLATPLKIVGLTALFVLSFNLVGYLLAASLYLFILLLWVSRYGIAFSAVLAGAIGVASWIFFGKILAVPLPQGFLPF